MHNTPSNELDTWAAATLKALLDRLERQAAEALYWLWDMDEL
jgi:hypothetical protein